MIDDQVMERVRQLNYDHHRRMTELHEKRVATGVIKETEATDTTSYQTLLSLVPKNRQHVLELGSSTGGQFWLLKQWLAADGTISGIDLYEPNVLKAQAEGLDIALGFVEDMHMFGDNIFDLVCSRHVMEHLGDLDAGISEILRVVKPGGYVAQVTPNMSFDPEPAHINQLNLQEWAAIWKQYDVHLVHARRYPYHGGEVHIVGIKQ